MATPPSPGSGCLTFQSKKALKVAKACDACRCRKVKCVREAWEDCLKCTESGLICTFAFPVQKKGPKRRYRQQGFTSSPHQNLLAPKESFRIAKLYGEESFPKTNTERRCDLPGSLISACCRYFSMRVQTHMPVISAKQLLAIVEDMDSSLEACCVIYAMCAYVILVALDTDEAELLPFDYTIGPEPMTILQATVEMRRSQNYDATSSTTAIRVSAFLCDSYERLGLASLAWFYLREATTLVYTAGLYTEEHYEYNGVDQTSQERCLFWYLFVKERVYALKDHRPLSLSASIHPPTSQNVDLDEQTLCGFAQLVNLYRQIDAGFFTAWNEPTGVFGRLWFAQFQQKMHDAVEVTGNTIDSQIINLVCSQAWIQILIWQLALRQGLLSSQSNVEPLTFNFPCKIGSNVIRAIANNPMETLRAHGASLTEKLFEIASCVMDITLHVPTDQDRRETSPTAIANSLLEFVYKLPQGESKYAPILLSKGNGTHSVGSLLIDKFSFESPRFETSGGGSPVYPTTYSSSSSSCAEQDEKTIVLDHPGSVSVPDVDEASMELENIFTALWTAG